MVKTIPEHFAAVMAQVDSRMRARGQRSPEQLTVGPQIAGRVLASDVAARLPVPPWTNSAMDGFLVRRADITHLPCTVPVTGDVPAGAPPQEVPPGQAVRIMTGGAVIDTHDVVVVPVEDTDIPPGPHPLAPTVTINRLRERTHIRHAGDNMRPGDTVATAGTTVNGATIAALISAGVTQVDVVAEVRVGIISSGDELVDIVLAPGVLAPGQLPDSNGPMVHALAQAACPARITRTHCRDDAGGLATTLARLARENDVIITTGGVSAGAFDVVHETLSAPLSGRPHGDSFWFGHVAQKPGAPQGISTYLGCPVISLPGNPVAAFASFYLYAWPALRLLAGRGAQETVTARPRLSATLADDLPVKPQRTFVVPVRLDFAHATPLAHPFSSGPGSHLVASLAGTDGFIILDSPARAGDTTTVYLY